MSKSRRTLHSLAAAASAVALAGLGLAASTASADPLPLPLPLPTSSSGDDLITTTTKIVAKVTAPLTGTGTTSGSGSGSAGSGSTTSSGGSSGGSAPLAPVGTAVKDVLNKADSATKDTPLAPIVPGGAPGEVLKLSLNAAPIAKACAQVTGSGTAVANIDLNVLGHDIGTPVVQALPGLLAPCPTGSTPTTTGVDAKVSDLVGACVRITPQPPLKASVLLLNHELVEKLTKAGLPLDKLVVPCPKAGGGNGGGGNGGGGNGGGGNGGGDDGGDDNGGNNGGGSGGNNGGGSGGNGAGNDGGVCPPTMNTQNAGFLPTSAPQVLPWVLLALALVGRRRIVSAVERLRPQRGGAEA